MFFQHMESVDGIAKNAYSDSRAVRNQFLYLVVRLFWGQKSKYFLGGLRPPNLPLMRNRIFLGHIPEKTSGEFLLRLRLRFL